jgi:hypothetical protein
VVYVLEFLAYGSDGGQDFLDNLECRATTLDGAEGQARTMGKNVKVKDRKADVCIIKDQMGNRLRIVMMNAQAP